MNDLPITRDWRFRAGLFTAAVSLVGLALVPSQVLEPKFGARSIAFSPKAMPTIALGLMALLGGLMAVGTALSRGERHPAPPEGLPKVQVLAAMALMVAYVSAIDQIGLIVASGICIAALALLLGNRNLLTIVALAIAVPAAIWLIFKETLKVFLPEGRLFGGLF